MRASVIVILGLCLFSSMAAASPIQVVPPQLQPLAWSVGNWQCVGHYETVPPFTSAHDDVAAFNVRVGIGDAWMVGLYQEVSTSDGSPTTAIHDDFALDQLGIGTRSFEDSNAGRFGGGFVLTSTGVEFTGSYTIFGQSVGFTETLTRGTGDASFSTESRVLLPIGPNGAPVPIVFHRQTCTKL